MNFHSIRFKLVFAICLLAVVIVLSISKLTINKLNESFTTLRKGLDNTSLKISQSISLDLDSAKKQQEKQIEALLKEKALSMSSLIANSAADALLTFEKETLNKYCEDVCQDKDVIFAYVSDLEGVATSYRNSEEAYIGDILALDSESTVEGIIEYIVEGEIAKDYKIDVMESGEKIGEVHILLSSDTVAKSVEEIENQFKKLSENTTGSLNGLNESVNEQLKVTTDGIYEYSNKAIYICIFSSIIASLIIVTPILSKIKKIKTFSEQLGEGDFTSATNVSSKDELGIISSVLDNTVHNLCSKFEVIDSNSNNLSTVSESLVDVNNKISTNSKSLKESSHNITLVTEEIIGALKNISESSQESSQNTHSIAQAIENLEHNFKEVMRNNKDSITAIQTVAAAVEELNCSLDEVSSSTENAVSITKEAIDASERTNSSVSSLEGSANEISGIIELIKGIADQTKTLALNATIEAARAGEAGKGFAVVASEVKILASKTAEATETIENKVHDMLENMESSKSATEEINKIIETINSTFTSVATAVTEQTSSVQEIASTMETASQMATSVDNEIANAGSSIQNISTNIEALSQASSEQAATTEQVSQSTNEITEIVKSMELCVELNQNTCNNLNDLVDTLSSNEIELQQAIKEFKIA